MLGLFALALFRLFFDGRRLDGRFENQAGQALRDLLDALDQVRLWTGYLDRALGVLGKGIAGLAIALLLDSNNSPTISVEGTEITDGYHNLSHHGRSEKKLTQLEAIDTAHMKLLAELLQELKSVAEPPGKLLDSTMVLYGSNFGDANKHTTDNMPILLAGGKDKNMVWDAWVNQVVNQVKQVILFDFYKGKGIAEGKKSYGVSFYLQDDKKTLTEKDIDRIIKKISDRLIKELKAELR